MQVGWLRRGIATTVLAFGLFGADYGGGAWGQSTTTPNSPELDQTFQIPAVSPEDAFATLKSQLGATSPSAAPAFGARSLSQPSAPTTALSSPSLAAVTQSAQSVAAPACDVASATVIVPGEPEIVELARGLKHDVDLIYKFVHDNISYVPGWGAKRGPVAVLLDGEGNSFEQSALLVALLRESGYTANFVLGTRIVGNGSFGEDAAKWLDANDDPSGVAEWSHFTVSATPVGGTAFANPDGQSANIPFLEVGHAWVEVAIDGAAYQFDPSYKLQERNAGIDLVAATGYDKSAFLTSATAGATIATDSVQNLNRTNVRNNLTTFANNLISEIRTQHPGSTLSDIVGGKKIPPVTIPQRQQTLPNLRQQIVIFALAPVLRAKLTVQHLGINQEIYADQIAHRRLTIFYNASNQPVLRCDGVVLATGTAAAAGSRHDLTLSVDFAHPTNDNTVLDYSVSESIKAGSDLLIMSGWGDVGRAHVDRHRKRAQEAEASGEAVESEAVFGETLAIAGSAWLAQSTDLDRLSGYVNNFRPLFLGTVGIVSRASDGELYFSIPRNQTVSVADYTVQTGPLAWFPDLDSHRSVALAGNAFHSALESGVLQQTLNEDAASTIKMLDEVLSGSGKVHKATSATFPALRSQLQNQGYAVGALDFIASQFALVDDIYLPERGDLNVGTWTGYVYWGIREDENVTRAIAGIDNGLNGAVAGLLRSIRNRYLNMTRGLVRNVRAAIDFFADPVDLYTGNFYLEHDDLVVGNGQLPLSVGLQRIYNSGLRFDDGSLGRGWSHNLDLSVSVDSDGFQALGEDSPIDAAAVIVAQMVARDILKDQRSIDRLMIVAMVQAWAMEQMVGNVVTVKSPSQTQQFVRLADGTFSPPPGSADQFTLEADSSYDLRLKDGTELDFAPDGKISTLSNSNGVTLTFSYSADKLSSVSNGLGRTLTFTYSGDRISQVSDGTRSVSYAYDANGNLTTFTDAIGNPTTYAYDDPGRMTQIFLPANPTLPFVTNTYDSFDRVKAQTSGRGFVSELLFAGDRRVDRDTLGHERIVEFNPRGHKLRDTDALGNTIVTEYDGEDRPILITLPEGNSIAFTYDANHNPLTITRTPKPGSSLTPLVETMTYEGTFNRATSVTDAIGRTTDFAIDAANGNILKIETAALNGQRPTTTFTYNGLGQVLTAVDPEGRVTRNTYATNGNLLSVIEDDNNLKLTTHFDYDSYGNIISVTDPLGHETATEFDALRRATKITDPAPFFYETRITYDANDNVTEMRRQTGDLTNPWQTTTSVFDVAGNQTSTTDPIGNITTFEYDALEQLVKQTDAELQSEQFIYDPLGRLQVTVDAAGQIQTENNFTENGLPALLKDANNNVVAFTHDGFDRLVKTSFPDGTFQELTLDSAGRTSSTRTRAGDVITYQYDVLDRVVSKTEPGQSTPFTYSYDLTGLLTQASNASGSVTRSYDTAGRVSQENRGGLAVQSEYDAAGNRTRLTWPDGYFVDYAYDALNRLTSATENGATVLVTRSYDDLSRLDLVTLGNGVTTNYSFALNNDLLSITHNFPGGISDVFSYGYNKIGQQISLDVTNAVYLHKPAQDTTTIFQSNNLNQYNSVGGVPFNYDLNGNLSDDGQIIYSHDAESRLTGLVTSSSSASYLYGPLNRRSQKTVGTSVTRFVHDDLQEIADYDGNGNLVRRYVPGVVLGEILVAVESTGDRHYYHINAQGSTVARSNDSGSALNRYSYGVYGEGSGPGAAEFGFTGQRFDSESGLYFFRARFYSAELGRFLQPDPAGFVDGSLLYAYVGNDPLSYADPTGLFADRVRGFGNKAVKTLGGYGRDFVDSVRSNANYTTTRIRNDVSRDFRNFEEAFETTLEALNSFPTTQRVSASAKTGAFLLSALGTLRVVKEPARFVSGVTVTDKFTGRVFEGTVDLGPTLDRIRKGVRHPHRNDGGVFENRKTPLPRKPEGYYTEFVHPTPGVKDPGPQRIIRGAGGEFYYTPDHYKTFIPLN